MLTILYGMINIDIILTILGGVIFCLSILVIKKRILKFLKTESLRINLNQDSIMNYTNETLKDVIDFQSVPVEEYQDKYYSMRHIQNLFPELSEEIIYGAINSANEVIKSPSDKAKYINVLSSKILNDKSSKSLKGIIDLQSVPIKEYQDKYYIKKKLLESFPELSDEIIYDAINFANKVINLPRKKVEYINVLNIKMFN
jgi:hypothetical protein